MPSITSITLRTGNGSNVSSGTAGSAGTLYIKGGNGGVSSSGSGVQGNGGNLIISGGGGGVYGSNSGKGGIVTISGGTGDFLKGGNVEIYGGKTNQNGRGGDIIINTPSNYQTGNIYISTDDGGYTGGDILIRPGLGPSSNGTLYIGNVSSPNESYKYKLHVSGHTVHNGVIYNYEYSNRAQFIGNWNQNQNDNWGIGNDGTTDSVIKLGRCDHLGVWNSSNVNVNINGSLTTGDLKVKGNVNLLNINNIYHYESVDNIGNNIYIYNETVQNINSDKIICITCYSLGGSTSFTYKYKYASIRAYNSSGDWKNLFTNEYTFSDPAYNVWPDINLYTTPFNMTVLFPKGYSTLRIYLFGSTNTSSSYVITKTVSTILGNTV